MADREKVIRGLEVCYCPPSKCDDCSHHDLESCNDALCLDALSLLKEHETEWEHLWDSPDGTFKGKCKKCGFVHFFIEGHDVQYKFCPECGRRIRW